MPQEWTKEEVLKLRKEVEKMKESEREKFLEGWSAEHYGQEFGHWPLFPVKHIVPDCLHLFQDHFNCAVRNAFHNFLLTDDIKDKELKELTEQIREQINKRLSGFAAEGGSNLQLTLGYTEKKHALNGPKMKAMAHHRTLLKDMCHLMTPLWDLMEAKDHPAVKKKALSAEEQRAAAAAEAAAVAAELTAAAGESEAPAKRGRGQKKQNKRGAHLKKKAAPKKRMRPVLTEDQSEAPVEEEPEPEEWQREVSRFRRERL